MLYPSECIMNRNRIRNIKNLFKLLFLDRNNVIKIQKYYLKLNFNIWI